VDLRWLAIFFGSIPKLLGMLKSFNIANKIYCLNVQLLKIQSGLSAFDHFGHRDQFSGLSLNLSLSCILAVLN
jgi:hypothetical protein